MGQDIDFATLIGSRICHDLISPIGAINNGMELLEMSAPAAGPEMSLISESVSNASARIRFFRIAFGAAGDQGIGRPEVVSILQDIYAGTRMNVDWGPTHPQQRQVVRLAFLGLLCLETAMPYGGQINISEGDAEIRLTAIADKLKVDADLWGRLQSPSSATDLRPAHVQFGLLPAIAASEGRKLGVEITPSQIAIQI